jgi:hypothetical protein
MASLLSFADQTPDGDMSIAQHGNSGSAIALPYQLVYWNQYESPGYLGVVSVLCRILKFYLGLAGLLAARRIA